MRPGMQTLLNLLRGELSRRSVAAEEWMVVLDLAEDENVLPWTASCMRAQQGQEIDARIGARLRAIERDARVSAFLWSETLRSTLAEFHRRSLPVISLKGPWLAQRLYGDAALRLYTDLDLLVRRTDFMRASGVLFGLGFSPTGRREDCVRTWRRDGIVLELHDDVENPLAFDFGTDAAWERAQAAEFEGIPARLLAPTDELRFLCLHGARHSFERLSHVLDLALAFRRWGRNQADASPEHSRDSQRALVFGAMMAMRLDPRLRELVSHWTAAPETCDIEEAAERVWQQRMRRPAPALDWRAKHRFLLSLAPPGADRLRARVRHLKILSTRLIDIDFAFAARFHLHRTWQVWMLRPMRLLLRACRALPETS